MKIHKGTFKIREGRDGYEKWTLHEGSYAHDYPFYIHRKKGKWWTLSHMSTGYAIKRHITLKQARELCKTLKEWPLFLMPTVETINHQKSLLPTHKQQLLAQIIHDNGDTNEQ